MKIYVFNIKFPTNPNQSTAMTKDPFVLDVPENVPETDYICEWFNDNYAAIPTFDWEAYVDIEDDDDNTLDDQYPSVNDFAEEIRHLLRRYFECDDNGDPNVEHDPDYTAQNFVDDVHDLVGNI